MKAAEIETGVLQAVARCRNFGIPTSELDDMSDLTKAGEAGVALENLCTQLGEYEAALPPDLMQQIEMLGRAMELDAKYWNRLRVVSQPR